MLILKKAVAYRKNNLFDFKKTIYLNVDSLIDINNVMTGSNNIALRKVHVKPDGYEKMYMDKDLIEDKLYELIDPFNEKTLVIEIFILHYWTIYIHVMREVGGVVRYYMIRVIILASYISYGQARKALLQIFTTPCQLCQLFTTSHHL